jgi:hypothetical protein
MNPQKPAKWRKMSSQKKQLRSNYELEDHGYEYYLPASRVLPSAMLHRAQGITTSPSRVPVPALQ